MNSTSSPRVGFIGLGSQGGPMARRIIEAGYPVTLWARRPAAGGVIAVHSTAHPDTCRRLAERAQAGGVRLIQLIADVAAAGDGERGATRLAAADAALALMNVERA